MNKKLITLSLALLTTLVCTGTQTVYAATGWQLNDGKYYYYNNDGTMKTKWFNPQPDIWYYFKDNGEMATGLISIGKNNTYYFSPYEKSLGIMCTGWHEIDRNWYYFDRNNSEGSWGSMHKGWLNPSKSCWYYLGSDGKMITGLYKVDKDHKYYFNPTQNGLGLMYTGWKEIDHDWYYFDVDNNQGSLGSAHNGWLSLTQSDKYYFDSDNKMKTGWLEVSPNEKYYFNTDGKMRTGWLELAPNEKYYFGSNGQMKIGWFELTPNEKYYFNTDGKMQIGKTTINRIEYDFGSNGILVK